jgi:hypothetical protein
VDPARDAAGRFAPRDLTTDPQVQALIAAEVKKASRDAAERARAAAQQEAEQAAARAKLDEVQRLQAEKADAEQRAEQALAAAQAAQADAEFSLALVGLGVQLAGPEASEMIRWAASKRRSASPDLSWADAVRESLEANPYLQAAPVAPTPQSVPTATPLNSRPAVQPAPPAPASTPQLVDVTRMSPADYQAYKRARYGS